MNLLTFDIEDYYHLLDVALDAPSIREKSIVVDATSRILDLLEELDVRGAFFILGEVAEKHPKLVAMVSAAGHLLGSHSYEHRMHCEMSDEEFENDTKMSLELISNASGAAVEAYRAPGFSLTLPYLHRYQILSSLGIKHDFSLFDGKASHGGIKIPDDLSFFNLTTDHGNIFLSPFKRSVILGKRIAVLGGGYFRLCPYQIVSNALSKHSTAVTYFHPRDFDETQPKIPGLSLARQFKSYVGIKGAFSKLRRMLNEHEFIEPNDYINLKDSKETSNIEIKDIISWNS